MIRPISEGDAWVTNDDGDIIGIQLHGRSEVVDLSNPVNGKVDPVTGMVELLAGEARVGTVSRFGPTPFGGVPVADAACSMPDSNYSTVVSGTSVKKWRTTRKSNSLRLVYVNRYNSTSADGTPLIVNASVESSEKSGTRVQATFSGQKYGVIAPLGVLVSDAVQAAVASGGYIFTRTNSAGPNIPYKLKNLSSSAMGEGANHVVGTAGADLTATGTVSNGNAGYSPLCVVGDDGIGLPYVVINGDSNNSGTGDSVGDYLPGKGWCARLFGAASVPVLNVSFDGRQLGNDHTYVHPLFAGATDILTPLIINDISANVGDVSFATFQTRAITEWRTLKTMYPKAQLWQSDAIPNTSSSDSWATVEGQSPLSSETKRLQANAWLADGAPLNLADYTAAATGASGAGVIRAGRRINGVFVAGDAAHPLYSTINISAAVTDYKSNGDAVWAAGTVYATDGLGIHATKAGCIAMAESAAWVIDHLQVR